ncbi:HAD-IIA family hydrolase [Rhodococcus sp. 114MFTsu3.1]|uniref:HAD-IIA family hydrolase n=1 Tax=Rhodococcus sp. 114MFTsu3.1 TaxID=1172184 RepID=UPI001E448BF7|nr:HAD-IIA family hydrolase [Rhodococcus sp. 114MFTsu3.1]
MQRTLADTHDCLMLDLDGTVCRGSEPTDGAVDALARVPGRKLFVTNNASRSVRDVEDRLHAMGIAGSAADIATSGQSAARILATRFAPRSRILVLGTVALVDEICRAGLTAVRTFREEPIAVVQGHSPLTGWADLKEAVWAIRAGAPWIVTNMDMTLPTEHGLVPGNGSMAAALRAACGVDPEVVGKPAPVLYRDALARGTFHRPLVVGDRLDTDIAGANAAGLPSLLVLTGVSSAADILRASPAERPTHIARNLSGINDPVNQGVIGPQTAWNVKTDSTGITISSTGVDPSRDGLSIIRAAADEIWRSGVPPEAVSLHPGDATAHLALQQWSVELTEG